MQNKKTEFILVDKTQESDNVFSLFFQNVEGSKYEFISGQYVDARPAHVKGHGKCYTISSIPSDEFVSLTIKKKGEMSSALTDMIVGDKAIFNGPYGNFCANQNGIGDIVMIAGGIGITPFYSFIRNALNSGSNTKLTLIYSNKTKNDIVFYDNLNELSKSNSLLEVVYCLTQEKTTDPLVNEYTRIDEDILNRYAMPNKDKSYYICGSIGFVDSIWKALKEIGVLEESIFTESFY